MSAVCGNAILESLSLHSMGLAGMMEQSPLQRSEAETATGLPFLEARNLVCEQYAAQLMRSLQPVRQVPRTPSAAA